MKYLSQLSIRGIQGAAGLPLVLLPLLGLLTIVGLGAVLGLLVSLGRGALLTITVGGYLSLLL